MFNLESNDQSSNHSSLSLSLPTNKSSKAFSERTEGWWSQTCQKWKINEKVWCAIIIICMLFYRNDCILLFVVLLLLLLLVFFFLFFRSFFRFPALLFGFLDSHHWNWFPPFIFWKSLQQKRIYESLSLYFSIMPYERNNMLKYVICKVADEHERHCL